MKKVGNWVAIALRPTFLFLSMSLLVIFLLWFLLGSLVPGFSDGELVQRGASGTLRSLVDNPLGAPHKILQFIPQHFKHHGPFLMRSASAFIGLFVAGCFYYILNQWYSRRVAILGTVLFVCSAWFLHTARLGTESINYALLLAAAACTVWLQKSRGSTPAVLAGACLIIVLLYIPGMIWFIVPGMLWQSQRIAGFLKRQHASFLTLIALAVVAALAPLGWAVFQNPELVKAFFGLPSSFPTPIEVLKNIIQVPSQLFFRGPDNPEIWLGRLPLLDWFSMAMFVAGAYAYSLNRKLDRTTFMTYIAAVGTLLIGLGGPVTISILMPFVYLVITGGIALMLQQWFTVFPVNPVAKTLGASLMSIAILLAAYYNFNHYFIAWPNAPETKQVYQNKP